MQDMVIMGKKRLCLIVALLGLLISMMGACYAESDTEITKTVGTVGEARNAFLASLRQQEPQNAPLEKSVWQREKSTRSTLESGIPNLTVPEGEIPDITVGIIGAVYVSGNWRIEISAIGVPPEGRVYDVCVRNDELNLGWFGKVYASGVVSQISACE